MIDNKYNIAVYKTDNIHTVKMIEKRMKSFCDNIDNLDIIVVTPEQISQNILMNPDITGLIVPGRNRGKDFERELGLVGLAAMDQAIHTKGLRTLKICAGSYNASRLIEWNNAHEPKDATVQINPYPQFQGRSVGAFNGLLKDGYISNTSHNPSYTAPVLSAQVANISYSSTLTGQGSAQSGHCLYWGGGAFFPDDGAHPDLITLASHEGEIDVCGQKLVNPAAVIEFTHGHGKVILSNIHPEFNATLFGNMFCMTPKARTQNNLFQLDKQNLAASENLYDRIFQRFLNNCLELCPIDKPVIANSSCNQPILC